MLTVAFMTVPNLIGLLILHKEVKSTIGEYWVGFRKEYPEKKEQSIKANRSRDLHLSE